MNIATLEDINTVEMKNGFLNDFHTIDTGLIPKPTYTNVYYDFVKITHSTSANKHNFVFKVYNNAWTGGYYVLDENDNYLSITGTCTSYDDYKEISFTNINYNNIKLVLYLSDICTDFKFQRLPWRPINLSFIQGAVDNSLSGNYFDFIDFTENIQLGTIFSCFTKNSDAGSYVQNGLIYFARDYTTMSLYASILNITFGMDGTFRISDNVDINESTFNFYFNVFRYKTNSAITVSDSLVLGSVNTLELDVKPFLKGDYISSVIGTVKYLNVEVPILCDNKNPCKYYCIIDLTNIYDKDYLYLNVHVEESDIVKEELFKFKVDCDYLTVSNLADFKSAINGDMDVIKLASNITLNGSIKLNKNIKIIGDDNTSINLNNHSFILNEGVNATFENILFNIGNNTIIQERNSTLTLNDCKFTNCKATHTGGVGSCVYCNNSDIDDVFHTYINNTTFIDNECCVFTNGMLESNNVKLHNSTPKSDLKQPAFLYLANGEASIKNSLFDIDYDTNYYCTNQINIGNAQALFYCGKSAIINNTTYEQLKENTVNFFDIEHNNRSHIYCKYYYTDIEECVITSPDIGKEDKAFCYIVSDEEYIYKQNVQLTKASTNNSNTNRKITWEG